MVILIYRLVGMAAALLKNLTNRWKNRGWWWMRKSFYFILWICGFYQFGWTRNQTLVGSIVLILYRIKIFIIFLKINLLFPMLCFTKARKIEMDWSRSRFVWNTNLYRSWWGNVINLVFLWKLLFSIDIQILRYSYGFLMLLIDLILAHRLLLML